ncbi:MAG: tRNA (adenosine(37)-N6)-threonylcarbamoyltransferase complex dimerization subunit type 1 TsaB [Bacteroidales bacterium]
MSNILIIESSSPVCSVAIAMEGHIKHIKEDFEQNHASLSAFFVEELLQETGLSIKNIDAIALSEGPGSYTGLRIGASLAKGLAYGGDIPIICINTLEAMTEYIIANKILFHLPNDTDNTLLVPMIDARRMEVYTTFYDIELNVIRPMHPLILDENTFSPFLSDSIIVTFGTGAEKCRDLYKNDRYIFIDAQNMLSARFLLNTTIRKYKDKDFVDTAYFEPNYLKNFIASIPRNKVL